MNKIHLYVTVYYLRSFIWKVQFVAAESDSAIVYLPDKDSYTERVSNYFSRYE